MSIRTLWTAIVLMLAARPEPGLDAALKEFGSDEKRPLSLRLKALNASSRSGAPLALDACQMLLRTLTEQNSTPARLEAARILARAKLTREQMPALAPTFHSLGPMELHVVASVIRSAPDAEVGKAFAAALAKSVALASFQESEIRTLFGNLPPECFEVVAPALRELADEDDSRRRKLDTLPALVSSMGRAAEGRQVFESGKGACSACPRIGDIRECSKSNPPVACVVVRCRETSSRLPPGFVGDMLSGFRLHRRSSCRLSELLFHRIRIRQSQSAAVCEPPIDHENTSVHAQNRR